ncbi:hypothetical protein ACWCQK_05320 [Streptomyces sp. NPDC002306]
MLELLWFPWAAGWFLLLDKLTSREVTRNVLWVLAAIGSPLVGVVIHSDDSGRWVIAAFSAFPLAFFLFVAWFIAEPPAGAVPSVSLQPQESEQRTCFRESPPAACSWAMCHQMCVFSPDT